MIDEGNRARTAQQNPDIIEKTSQVSHFRGTRLAHQDRLNIAVFIDFDNIEIGVKSTLGEHFDVGTILDTIKERGEVVTKIAYADWTRAGEYSRTLTQHAIRLVQRNLTPGGDKNGADINLALDALEMAFTHPHINAYVIVGGDSDFLSLVEKLKQYDKKVFVVGGRAFTSIILQRNCHEFIAYENLTGARRPAARGGRPVAAAPMAPVAQAFPIVRRALKILADREVTPQTGLLKSTLLQLDSTFSERTFGASSFLDFTEKLAHAGFITLKHSGRSVMVELNEEFKEDADPAEPKIRTTTEGEVTGAAPVQAGASAVAQHRSTPAAEQQRARASGDQALRSDPVPQTEGAAEGVRRAGRILAAATNVRWPMYLRNVKQILRQAEGGFDERRYGFGGLMDLLRACQKEGFVRIERDRRGGLRVFAGSALQARPAAASTTPAVDEPLEVVDVEPIETQSGEMVQPAEPLETEQPEAEPVPVDTTAELLGRAKPKRSARARVHRAAPPRKTAARKPAASRRSRAKKSAGPPPASHNES
jgi:uncharacterized LabA/DUF88 family protein